MLTSDCFNWITDKYALPRCSEHCTSCPLSNIFTAVHARSLCCCQNTDKTRCSLVITMNISASQLDSNTTVYSNSTKKKKKTSQCRHFSTYVRVSVLQTLTSLEFHKRSEFDTLPTKYMYVHCFIYLYGSRDCVIGTGTRLRIRSSEVRIPVGVRFLSLP